MSERNIQYITKQFYCLAVEAGFNSDVVECLSLDSVAQVRFTPLATGMFLHPVTFGDQGWESQLGFWAPRWTCP